MIRCIFFLIAGSATFMTFSCSRVSHQYENLTDDPGEHPPHSFEGIPSFYDTVFPVRVHIKDRELYEGFAKLMRFSDQMPSDDTTRGMQGSFWIDSTGTMRGVEDRHATERPNDFDGAYDYLRKNLTWSPASLKRDTTIKYSVRGYCHVDITRDSVILIMASDGEHIYLSKRYARPLTSR